MSKIESADGTVKTDPDQSCQPYALAVIGNGGGGNGGCVILGKLFLTAHALYVRGEKAHDHLHGENQPHQPDQYRVIQEVIDESPVVDVNTIIEIDDKAVL